MFGVNVIFHGYYFTSNVLYISGNTTVIAGIYGPVEAKPQKMIYDKASVEVSYCPIKGPTSKSN